MKDLSPTPRVWLENAYRKRRSANAAYSLRAFARYLGLPSGRLSEILSDKRPLTDQMGRKIAARLALPPNDEERFLRAIHAERIERRSRSVSVSTSEGETEERLRFRELEQDAFHAVADWHHFAILSLMDIRGFRDEPAWIARRLGISSIEARAALDRMTRLGMIARTASGALEKTSDNFCTTHDLPSAALRESHRQSIAQAAAALETIAVELRDVSSMTMAIDPARLPEAKVLLKQFRRKLCAVLETGRRSEVYNLNIQLVPVSIPEKGPKKGSALK